MLDFLKRLWRRRWVRVCTWLIAALVAAPIVAVVCLDLWGARRWEATKEMLAREGESLDLHKIAPDPVPDEENFFAIPALNGLAVNTLKEEEEGELDQKRKRLLNAALPKETGTGTRLQLLNGATLGRATDLAAWADWLRRAGKPPAPPSSGNPARDVLAALSRNDGLISELAHGLSRPQSQWTPAWKKRVLPKNIFIVAFPQYRVAQTLVAMLCLRSAAAARAGDAAKAHQSLLIAVRINQAFMQEPSLIGALVACGDSAKINGAVWELCDAHAGTAEDFRRLQAALSGIDFHAGYLLAERGEMAGGALSVEYLKQTKEMPVPFLLVDDPWGRIADDLLALPRRLPAGAGWLNAIAAADAEFHFEYEIKPLREPGFQELLAKQKELEARLTGDRSRLYLHLDEMLAMLGMSAISNVSYRVIYTQSVENEAIAACALERYRIEHNAYPDTLEAANWPGEKSIPADVISGKPMVYRKAPDGRYALWCVGFDGKDHGGKRVLDEKNPGSTRFSSAEYHGDWVWDFSSAD